MAIEQKKKHASDSSEQQLAECEMLAALAKNWSVRLDGRPDIEQKIELDGFADGDIPICVEVWAHQGPAKGGQRGKVMRDCCKLLLVEKLLGRKCRKVFAVCDEQALKFLANSWQGVFADAFDIERVVVEVSDDTHRRVREAQKRQFR